MAMGGTLFVASLPLLLQHGQDGYTDLPLAYFVTAGAIALARYTRGRRVRDLILASVMAGGMVWTREDAAILVVINGALVLYDRTRPRHGRTRHAWVDLARYLGAPGLIWGTWALAKSWMTISSNLAVPPLDLAIPVERFWVAFEAMVTALFLEGNWMILWALVVVALVDPDGKRSSQDARFFLWPVILYLGVVAVLTAGTALFEFVEVRTVLNRLILHVAPLAALWVAITYGRWWGLERASSETGRLATRTSPDG
jgi:hypothetical protein